MSVLLTLRPVLAALSFSALLGASAAPVAVTLEEPDLKKISRELAKLFQEDQADQEAWEELSDEEFSRRQDVRRLRALEIVENGWLSKEDDWHHAGMLLQHGSSAEDYLLAHVLSLRAGVKDRPFGRFLCAATLDRFLQSVGRPQIFSTQSSAPTPDVYAPVEPFDDSLAESVRAVFGLDPLARPAQASEAGSKVKGGSAKELKKLLSRAKKQSGKSDGDPDWLVRTRELVLAGVPDSKKDYQAAAELLARGTTPEDLLSAHVMAAAALLKGAKNSLEPAARSLDRFLVGIDRLAVFGTLGAPEDGSPPSPLHASILAEFGLGAGQKAGR